MADLFLHFCLLQELHIFVSAHLVLVVLEKLGLGQCLLASQLTEILSHLLEACPLPFPLLPRTEIETAPKNYLQYKFFGF